MGAVLHGWRDNMAKTKVKIDMIDHSDRFVTFVVQGLTPAFANGIRRAMLTDVPTLSIDTIRVTENTSVLFDEIIGHRLCLVPLTTPTDEFEYTDVVTLTLDVQGPATVYSGDLVSPEKLVEPADKRIPIVDLKENQRLAFEADAVLGTGRTHAKFQGGVAIGYTYLQSINVLGTLKKGDEQTPLIVRGAIEDSGKIIPTSEFGHNLSNKYPKKKVEVTDVPNTFVFHVETDGSMSSDELITSSVQSLCNRAGALGEGISI
jgi:DNA-directed RNA polymerase subunit D